MDLLLLEHIVKKQKADDKKAKPAGLNQSAADAATVSEMTELLIR